MSKKKSKKKTNKENTLHFVTQIGNFAIKKKHEGDFSFVRIMSIDGSWRMDFREDTFKYSWILMLASEEKYHGILQAWLVIVYHTAMCNPDPEFIDGILKEFEELSKRTFTIENEPEKESLSVVSRQNS